VGIEKLKEEYEIDLIWRGFPLHPEVPEEGVSTKDLFKSAPVDIEKMRQGMKEISVQVGLPLGQRGMVYNSRLAQELGFWADSMNKGDQFHKAVFKAYFVSGSNIGSIPVLVDIAASVGLSAEEAEDVMQSRVYKIAVDLDWSLAKKLNIHVVPTFVINNHGLFGMQTYETLERLITSQGATKR